MMQKSVMKNISFVITFFAVFLCLASSVWAADIAYLYRKDFNIDQNVVNVFGEMGLDVELVNERALPKDFSDYKLVFIGDEVFTRNQFISVEKYPTIISSFYYGEIYGITDNEGVSQLGSTSPLTIMEDGSVVQVYTSAFKEGRVAVPYYFLDKENKAESLLQIAATKTTSSGRKFGDVISYALPGAVLENHKVTKEEICFFGLVETEFWTEEAEEMFKNCARFVLSECQVNEDCAAPFFPGEPFCTGNDVVQTKTFYTCEQIESQGRCVPHNTDILQKQCEFACANGNCIRCDENLDCDDGKLQTEDICSFAGTEDSVCTNRPIECFVNADCGTDGFVGEMFCSDELHTAQLFETFTCNEPGTGDSFCSSATEETVQETCEDICVGGVCEFFVCESDSECDDQNVNTEDVCVNPSTLDSVCENNPIECFANEDCGTDGFVGERICSDSLTASQMFREFTCSNAGTAKSACSYAEELQAVETCADLCFEGACVDVACFEESDCGTDGFVGEMFCSEGNVAGSFVDYSCNDAGTHLSVCASETSTQNIETCQFGCENGLCLPGVHDVGFVVNDTYSKGIKIQQNNVDVNYLVCGEEYEVSARIQNFGDFNEVVSFLGAIGPQSIQGNNLSINVGETKTAASTFAPYLIEGVYNLTINTALQGFEDEDATNNFATREIFVSCQAD